MTKSDGRTIDTIVSSPRWGERMRGNRKEVWDYLDLALLWLAKTNRQKAAATSDKAFYETFFTSHDEELLGSDADPRRRHRGRILRETVEANVPAAAEVLDVGCGTGDNLNYIAQSGLKLSGIEYAESTAAIARRALGTRADIRIASATAIPYPDKSFDLALCIEVLEHIEDDEKAMSEIARIVRPGGKLVLSLPYRYWFKPYFNLMGHYRHYRREDVDAMLLRHGFKPIRHLPNFPRWSRYANYTHVSCRIYSLLGRPFGNRASATDVKAPFSQRKLYDILFDRIEPVRLRETEAPYERMPTSTFVLAERLNG